MSGALGALGGGGQKTVTQKTGYYALPKELQDIYKSVLGQTGNIVLPGGQVNVDAFTPTPISAGEQSGLDRLTAGFTPTAQSLQSDLAMLMNPYDESVIGEINRQATGANSLTKQAGANAGQIGSNRNFLATSDVEQNRLNNIGQFKQSQYNTAINQILNNLVPQRQQDANNALAAGTYGRNIDMQTKQAPLNALNATTGALGQFAQGFNGNKGGTVETGGGLGGILTAAGNAASLGSGIYDLGKWIFSDRRLKEEIELIGVKHGYPIYTFKYKDGDQRYIGVMAQDVQKIKPEAVKEINGYLAVDYDQIGIEMRAI